MADAPAPHDRLTGARLTIAGLVLALVNFMVVLDTSIANVSVPHISGSLGVSPTQGTWVVTSYSVAEAICLPLTGWLSRRFGMVRTFMVAMLGFGLFSALCGIAVSLPMLVAFRVGQGLSGGPLIALTQTLIIRVFPPKKRPQALGVWAMTTVVAPIAGPILGGTISDNWSWPWIFYINVPIALLCAFGVFTLLTRVESTTERVRIDRIGLALMVVWIAALQIMLDLGRERDWFGSTFIVALGVIAAIGFVAFVIWELTDDEPIVDLRVFRHRGFTAAATALAVTYGIFFSTVVIVPQWLQGAMGYTATDAGYVTAWVGVFAIVMSPIVARLGTKVDPRLLGSLGIAWFGVASLMRTHWDSGADYWTLALPQLVQGFGMPFFFIPIMSIGLGSVLPRETASAAGVMGFMRTLAAAIGTSIATTIWDDRTRVGRNELTNILNQPDQVIASAQGMGLSADQGRGVIERLVEQESVSLATNHVFMLAAFVFFLAATIIWLAPRPRANVDTSAAH